MFLQKVRRTSTLGTSTQSYSNTNQTGNSPVVQVEPGADTTKLDPTLTPTPNNPDTLTPPIQPAPTQPGLLLPVGGFFGTVYVVLTKPTPNAAVVVVEVTNEGMAYNPAIDKKMLDPEKEPDETEEPTEEVVGYSQSRFVTNMSIAREGIESAITNVIAPYENAIAINLDAVTELLLNKLIPIIKRASYLYTIDGVTEALGVVYSAVAESNVNFVTLNYGTSASGELLIPLTAGHLGTTPIQLGEQVDIQSEIYLQTGNVAVTKRITVNMYIEQAVTEDLNTTLYTGFLTTFDVTVKYVPAVYCHPFIEQFDIDTGTFRIVRQYDFEQDASVPDAPVVEKPPKRPVKRGYTNIGGKLVYLYSTNRTTETTVFVNYDGSNYGVIVTTPDRTATIKTGKSKPTASFTNNINSYSLNTAQQALLQTCLPIPDDTLQGGFKAMASNGTTELNFKSYGFNSIFYRTPTVYNQTTIKGCAVYGL